VVCGVKIFSPPQIGDQGQRPEQQQGSAQASSVEEKHRDGRPALPLNSSAPPVQKPEVQPVNVGSNNPIINEIDMQRDLSTLLDTNIELLSNAAFKLNIKTILRGHCADAHKDIFPNDCFQADKAKKYVEKTQESYMAIALNLYLKLEEQPSIDQNSLERAIGQAKKAIARLNLAKQNNQTKPDQPVEGPSAVKAEPDLSFVVLP
jgi:hypothetical protein